MAKVLWMRFLAAKTEEELDMLANTHPVMGKAVRKLEYVSSDPDLRYALDMREKAILDYNSAMITKFDAGIEKGIEKGRYEVARNMLRRNKPLQEIAEDTGLTLKEVEALRADENK